MARLILRRFRILKLCAFLRDERYAGIKGWILYKIELIKMNALEP
jgi:hypothetical protein